MLAPTMSTHEKRVNTGITILPSLRQEVTEYAVREDKTFSRFTEVILRWALEQMKRNNITAAQLKSWRAVPPRTAEKLAAAASDPPER